MNTVKWGSLGTFKDFSGTIRDLGEDPFPNPLEMLVGEASIEGNHQRIQY